MGVPGLFPYLRHTFPRYFYHFLEGRRRKDSHGDMDYIHIDGNAMIHPCAQIAFNYGPMARQGYDPNSTLTDQQRQLRAFELFWTRMEKIVRLYHPKVLNITFDGPAPLAKQNQQRVRRFQAKAEASDEKKPVSFDSTQISPGTIFSLELTKFLQLKIRKYINGPWKAMKIIFSSSQVPGEGEHKIMDYVRSLPQHEKAKKHMLVGEDGDLLFLSMATKIPNMFLLRADTETNNAFYHIDISGMTRALPEFVGSESVHQSIDDLIFLGFFVGNDFLPMIQMFIHLNKGFNQMVNIVTENNLRLTSKGRLMIKPFQSFVKILSQREPEDLFNEVDDFNRYVKSFPDAENFRNHTLEKFVSKKGIDYKGYREAYYRKSGLDVSREHRKISQMCEDYFKTLLWVFLYYTKGLPSWEWFYPWYYAPLMSDFSDYLAKLDQDQTDKLSKFEIGSPSKPFVQLLCILPSSSAYNLPAPYRHLMESPLSPLVEKGYYPSPPYLVDREGKLKEHMAVTIIQLIDDIQMVRDVFEGVSKRDPNYYARNDFTKPYLYRYTTKEKDTLYSYRSSYGSIKECRVEVSEIK